MKFFAVELSYTGLKVPRLKKWEERIKFQKLFDPMVFPKDEKVIMRVKSGDIFCPDMLTEPVFMVSNMLKELLEKFEPNLEWKTIILSGSNVNAKMPLYYAPKLFEIMADKKLIESKEKWCINKELILKQESIGERGIFCLQGKLQSYVVMRLDLVEMLLRREVLQDGLTEVTIVDSCK